MAGSDRQRYDPVWTVQGFPQCLFGRDFALACEEDDVDREIFIAGG